VREGKAAAAPFAADPFFGGGARRGGGRNRVGAARATRPDSRGSSKRRRSAPGPADRPGTKLARRKEEGLELHSDDEAEADGTEEDDEEDTETPAEKRLRLAQELIARVEEEEAEAVDGHDIDAQILSRRLRDDLAESKGTLKRAIAAKCPATVEAGDLRRYRHRGLPVTCLALVPEKQLVYCGAKDGSIIKWSLTAGERLIEVEGTRAAAAAAKKAAAAAAKKSSVFTGAAPDVGDTVGHNGAVLAIAVTTDATVVATGGDDRFVCIWDADSLDCLRKFKGHRDTVTTLAFRRKTHQLFSGSLDRTIKIWNLDAMSYVETLYGHQEGVLALSALDRDRAVSCGGRDRTVRLWKVVEESHAIFNGTGQSIDCVVMITESNFVSGSEDGVLALWDSQRKKPIATVKNAHGAGNWITAVGAPPYGDICASGSSDGTIRLWKCDIVKRRLEVITTIPVIGFITAIAFEPTGERMVAAVAQEHRLGRWSKVQKARNGFVLVPILPPP